MWVRFNENLDLPYGLGRKHHQSTPNHKMPARHKVPLTYRYIFEISWLRRRMTQEGGINRRSLQPEATSPVGEQVPFCTSVSRLHRIIMIYTVVYWCSLVHMVTGLYDEMSLGRCCR